MKTRLGIFLKKLRIDRQEIMFDMAEKLGVSTPFLSNVENGKKPMPDHMFTKICELYQLSVQQIEEFRTAVTETCNEIKLNLVNANDSNRKLAIVFARSFENLDDDTSEKIIKILERRRGIPK